MDQRDALLSKFKELDHKKRGLVSTLQFEETIIRESGISHSEFESFSNEIGCPVNTQWVNYVTVVNKIFNDVDIESQQSQSHD